MWQGSVMVAHDGLNGLPRVSVVIPTLNRERSLRETLDCLTHQTLPIEEFQVIVVDDGSTDSTPQTARGTYPFAFRYLRQSNQGSAAARNAGARHSHSDVLIFLDDDMTVDPDYLAAILQEHGECEKMVIMGAYRPWCPEKPTPFQMIAALAAANVRGDVAWEDIPFTECSGGNLSIKREDFFAAGMFHDVAGDPQTLWMDVDFGYRTRNQGFRFRRSHRATLCHRDYAMVDLSTSCRRAEIAAQRAVALFWKHPDLAGMLPMFNDKRPISWQTDPPGLVVRKLLRNVVSCNAVLSFLEYITHQLEAHFPRPFLLRPLYRWITGSYIFRGYREGLRQYGRPD
jgi:glycosyltransferase involved in cell wall biosynthesis